MGGAPATECASVPLTLSGLSLSGRLSQWQTPPCPSALPWLQIIDFGLSVALPPPAYALNADGRVGKERYMSPGEGGLAAPEAQVAAHAQPPRSFSGEGEWRAVATGLHSVAAPHSPAQPL